VGAGPDEQKLRAWCEANGLQSQVYFAGVKRDAELANLLNQHRILVIPSRWDEPFGIVALEAIACGCVVVGADAGGLPDAIGPAGVLYERGSVDALVSALRGLLLPGANLDQFRQQAGPHLAAHAASTVAARYLEVLEAAAAR
jgi:glycogen(starch) synthase